MKYVVVVKNSKGEIVNIIYKNIKLKNKHKNKKTIRK